jgi:hypothetical protein
MQGAASVLVYAIVTAVMGRDVLAHLGSTIASDPGDPLLTAAILKWNATHVPLTDAWYQFPIFYPTRDTLTFSEHLLGLSVIASPIYWLTSDAVVTYNSTLLLTFPLCAAAMYALVFRLTGSAAGAFVSGIAFGFAPYRIPQLPHIQMLATFWAPLALLGLHAYIETASALADAVRGSLDASGRRQWLCPRVSFRAGRLVDAVVRRPEQGLARFLHDRPCLRRRTRAARAGALQVRHCTP